MCRVSVIVPVFNTENYVRKCMDSLLNQTLDDLEIVAVDDGSRDRSGEILDEYARQFPQLRVFHQRNKGQGAARNLALSQCRGEYVGFLVSLFVNSCA